MFNIVLFSPEIPPNTGNIMRLCFNTGAKLHIIRPINFDLESKKLKRASLDHFSKINIKLYDDYDDFFNNQIKLTRIFCITKFGKTRYDKVGFLKNDFFLFGSETLGLPPKIMNRFENKRKLYLPMKGVSRSLNLSNAVSVVIYEAWRQNHFNGEGVLLHPQ
jgi:tRNA (cytidine/uridine-2'-O-)-methyltransferase